MFGISDRIMQMTGIHFRSIFVTALLCPLLVLLTAGDIRAEQQYIVINIAPEEVKDSVFEQIGQITEDKTSDHIGLGIYDWRGIKNNRAAIDAIQGLLRGGKAEAPSEDADAEAEGNLEDREL
jgi:hypothetical protein